MRLNPLTPDDLGTSVVAVPPLARNADRSLSREENVKLIRHLESGGVRILLYGGNANLYHVAVSQYAPLLELLAEAAGPETLVIPSVGPAYGTMMDQARILREYDFPTAMILPQTAITTPAGVEAAVRDFVAAAGRPAVLYIKDDGYIGADGVKRLVADGLLSSVKYAVVRDDPAKDPLLARLVDVVDPRYIMSGIGEQPAIVHLRDFGLAGFTSGCVCIAPRRSTDMLQALKAGDYDAAERIRQVFQLMENLRNRISPIRVLHDAVTLSGIADMGPILPLLSNLEAADKPAVRDAAKQLLALNEKSVP